MTCLDRNSHCVNVYNTYMKSRKSCSETRNFRIKFPRGVLVGKPEGKRHLGRTRRRWEDSIKMDLKEVGFHPRDWIALAEDRDQ